jgi:hypothetical protein
MEEDFGQVAFLAQFFVITALRIVALGRREHGIDAAVLELIDDPCGVYYRPRPVPSLLWT